MPAYPDRAFHVHTERNGEEWRGKGTTHSVMTRHHKRQMRDRDRDGYAPPVAKRSHKICTPFSLSLLPTLCVYHRIALPLCYRYIPSLIPQIDTATAVLRFVTFLTQLLQLTLLSHLTSKLNVSTCERFPFL